MGNVVLHIGVPKSGTTYLQGIMANNRGPLHEAGWLYPGLRLNQQHSVYGICGSDIGFLPSTQSYEATGRALLSKVHAVSGGPEARIMISAEILASLSDASMSRFVEQVGVPSRVVMTVRGLHSLLPSSWQQSLKTGHTQTLNRYIESFANTRENDSHRWNALRFGGVVRRWASVAPVHVAVVPRAGDGREELWRRFKSVSDLPDVPILSTDDRDANISLTREAAAVLRKLNANLRQDKVSPEAADLVRRAYLDHGVFPLGGGRDGGTRLALTNTQRSVLREWNQQEVDLLEEFSTEIVGDVSELTDTGDAQALTTLTAEQVADVAARQIIQFVREVGAIDGGRVES